MQALQQRYLEPPKSLHEAAARAWRPIKRRTYAFERRAHKAAAILDIQAQQLISFYDSHLTPHGTFHKRLCAQIWGSRGLCSNSQAAVAMIVSDSAYALVHRGQSDDVVQLPGNHAAQSGMQVVQARHEVSVTADQLLVFKQSQPCYPTSSGD
eukprot:jgi/Chrzof1/679/Cz01g24250.t1